MKIMFGPSGNSNAFYEEGYKSSLQMPHWLRERGLDLYEYNCTKGVKIKEDSARRLGENARENGIALTLHAQYYISLASREEEKRNRSVSYILESLQCARWIGAAKVVVHPGGLSKLSREAAFSLAAKTLLKTIQAAKDAGLSDIFICPETMGKINQLGTLEEILKFCRLYDCLLPTIDFGHLNARSQGGLKTAADYEAVIDLMIDKIGTDRAKIFHSHFSKIAYTQGGEKCHLTFEEDDTYGPDYEPLLEVLYKKSLTPTIICESAGTQAKDALVMKRAYEALCAGNQPAAPHRKSERNVGT